MGRPQNKKIIEADIIEPIGHSLWGSHWASEMGRALNVSKSLICRAAKDERTPNQNFVDNLHREMLDKIENIARMLKHKGLPNCCDPRAGEARQAILEAVKTLRSLAG
ncbi:MAG TPA: hypothetical protein VHC40_13925 [Rhizomicrobium sp.]|nr:hypothetical protein [Rhizomicrobium sp.]